MQAVFQTIDAQFDTYLQFWKAICGMETPSSDKDALDRQADFIAQFCQKRGFQVTRHEFELAGSGLVVETAVGGAGQPVALLAHMDTVHPKRAFGNPPVREKDGKLFGPGVFDCKGGIAVALLAMEALRQAGFGGRPLRLVLSPDEEVSCKFSGEAGIRLIQDAARGCAAAFNCESGRPGLLTVGRKGIVRLQIIIHGQAAHAGNGYFEGVSAIREAACKIIELEKHSQVDGTTFNCGTIHGGTVSNVVPEECVVEVDVRFWDNPALEQAMALVREIAGHAYVPGSSSKVVVLTKRPAMEKTAGNMRLFEQVRQAAEKYGLEKLEPAQRGGGSDSAYTVQIGVPTVCSMGTVGNFEHTVKEEAVIASLRDRAKLLAASIASV